MTRRRERSLKGLVDAARLLTAPDWCLLVEAWLRLQWVALLRGRAGVESANAASGRLPPVGGVDETRAWETIRRLHRLTHLASRLSPGGAACLRRSLVLQRLLAGRSTFTRLRIGVQKADGELKAHAWLEYGGVPVCEPGEVEGTFWALSGEEGDG